MRSVEKYHKMLSLEPYRDRKEMPVYPQMITTFAALAGKTQAEAYDDIDVWLECVDKTAEIIGKPDVAMPSFPSDAVFGMALKAKAPGRELGENELYQFIEAPYFDDPTEYKRIYDMGWGNWNAQYLMSVQTPPMTSFDQLGARFERMGQNMGKAIQHFYANDIVPAFDIASYPIYDAISIYRSTIDFICDLYTNPGPIMDIITKYQPEEDEKTIGMLKAMGGTRICMFAMHSSVMFTTPTIFSEYVWPHLKASIERYWAAGITTVLHADGDWLPVLHHFLELPRGCCHIELDGVTDIEKAYDILQGSQSIRGDVPATMFVSGTPDDVANYCEKLINMGMKGGFMLSSGCEVPINAKAENVKAMIDSVRG